MQFARHRMESAADTENLVVCEFHLELEVYSDGRQTKFIIKSLFRKIIEN